MVEYLVPFCGNCPKCKKYIPPTFSKQPNDKCPFCKYILKRKDWQPTFEVKLKERRYVTLRKYVCHSCGLVFDEDKLKSKVINQYLIAENCLCPKCKSSKVYVEWVPIEV